MISLLKYIVDWLITINGIYIYQISLEKFAKLTHNSLQTSLMRNLLFLQTSLLNIDQQGGACSITPCRIYDPGNVIRALPSGGTGNLNGHIIVLPDTLQASFAGRNSNPYSIGRLDITNL